MIDFWDEFDKSYRFFCQFCETDDWHIILKAVAGAVVRHTSACDCQLSLLDVGCGTGIATETICEIIYARTRRFPKLSIVEPSPIARQRLAHNALTESDCGPLIHTFETLDDVSDDVKFDGILFLHSTYYIDKIEEKLRRLVERNLRTKGAVFALVLPEESPFFLGAPCLANCSDAVEMTFRKLGLRIRTSTLKSRFYLPGNGGFTDAEADLIRKFFLPAADTANCFRRILSQYLGEEREIDFKDHLLIGEKK